MPDNTLTGWEIYIGIDEATGGGIVISAFEIVPARLFVIDVTAITEGLISADRVCQGTRCGKRLAPTIVSIFYNSRTAVVNEFYNVILSVAEIIIGGEVISIIDRIIYRDCIAVRVIGIRPERCLRCKNTLILSFFATAYAVSPFCCQDTRKQMQWHLMCQENRLRDTPLNLFLNSSKV